MRGLTFQTSIWLFTVDITTTSRQLHLSFYIKIEMETQEDKRTTIPKS